MEKLSRKLILYYTKSCLILKVRHSNINSNGLYPWFLLVGLRIDPRTWILPGMCPVIYACFQKKMVHQDDVWFISPLVVNMTLSNKKNKKVKNYFDHYNYKKKQT